MYSKLFSSILNSSVWSEDSDTCKVWITLLAMQDQEGYVFGSAAGVARIAALSYETVEFVMDKFIKPDPLSADLSREPEREGRRIEVVPGGWRLLNAGHYRALGTQEDRRQQNRDAQRRRREASAPVSKRKRASATVKENTPSDTDTDTDPNKNPLLLSTEEAPPSKKKANGKFKPPAPDEVRAWMQDKHPDWLRKVNPVAFCAFYESNGWKVGQNPMRSWKATVVTWAYR